MPGNSFLGAYTGSFKPSADLVAKVKQSAKPDPSQGETLVVDVPFLKVTPENFAPFGKIIKSRAEFDAYNLQINQWPSPNGRPVLGGVGGGTTGYNEFQLSWEGNECHVTNTGVDGHYVQGWKNTDSTAIYIRDANFHPDGDQIFWSPDGRPFITIVASHRDEATVTPSHFVAFLCDGSVGLCISPGTYHSAAFPFADKTVRLITCQGKVHGNGITDFHDEFGVYVRIPNAFESPSSTDLPDHLTIIPKPLNYDHKFKNVPKLPAEFARKQLKLETALPGILCQKLGIQVIPISDDYNMDQLMETIERPRWPNMVRPPFKGDEQRIKKQTLKLEWFDEQLWFVAGDNCTRDIPNRMVGVTRCKKDGKIEYEIQGLACRVDSAQWLWVTGKLTKSFIMLIAPSDPQTKDPTMNNMKLIEVPANHAIYLPPLCWHSAPIVGQQHAHFAEFCGEVDALVRIDVQKECGQGIRVTV